MIHCSFIYIITLVITKYKTQRNAELFRKPSSVVRSETDCDCVLSLIPGFKGEVTDASQHVKPLWYKAY